MRHRCIQLLELFLNDGPKVAQKLGRQRTNVRVQADLHRDAEGGIAILRGPAASPDGGSDEAAPLLKTLQSGESTMGEIAEAGARLAALNAAASGTVTEGFKKAVEEWRRVQAATLDLGERTGELISRAVAKVVVGQVASRAVQAFDRFDSRLAGQIEVWLGSREWLEVGPEERSRRVRQWTQEQTRTIRVEWAEEAERLIEAERTA